MLNQTHLSHPRIDPIEAARSLIPRPNVLAAIENNASFQAAVSSTAPSAFEFGVKQALPLGFSAASAWSKLFCDSNPDFNSCHTGWLLPKRRTVIVAVRMR
jgi:hypothetical protein